MQINFLSVGMKINQVRQRGGSLEENLFFAQWKGTQPGQELAW